MPVPTDKDRLLVHGVLMAVFGCGVIIVGPPGAGKSELALTLLDRGHALIADDAVVLEKRTGVFGSAPDVSRGPRSGEWALSMSQKHLAVTG